MVATSAARSTSVRTRPWGRAPRWLCLACSLWMAGCAVGPDFLRPGPPGVDRYTSGSEPTDTLFAEGQAQHFLSGAGVAADWWRLFGSSELDAVVIEAFRRNPGLEAAESSLRRSQDTLRAGYGVFFPQADAGFDVTRQQFNPMHLGQTAAPNTIFNLFTLSSTVNLALDVFGGQRRTVESLRADVDVQRQVALGTYLTLSGNIVNAVMARAGYVAEIQATEELIAQEQEQVRIAEIQAEVGTVPYLNVLAIQSQLATTTATLAPLRQRVSQTDHLLATLVGAAPAEWTTPAVRLADLTLPEDLPVSLPSDLVRQRPDILAAEAQLHSSSAAIGVATAALFPSFTLSGTAGLSNTVFGNLPTAASAFWTVGANVTAPLFRGGTLWFQRKAAIDAYQQTLANYRQTVLSALAQVADLLRALEHDAEALQAQSQALAAAAETLRLIQVNYEAGTANYLQVLVANAQYHLAVLGQVQAKAQRLQDTAALFVALGGGWWNATAGLPPAPGER
jgi:NodT family efflux transporter outer membrane factor (OMF) lipoprotein